MLFRRDDVCGSKIGNAHTSSSGGFSLPVLLVGVFSLLALLVGAPLLWSSLLSPDQAQAQELTPEPTLIETATKIFTVNIPASFKELVTMAALEVEGETLFGGSVTFAGGSVFDGQITLQGDVFADGINIDLGSGEITASNVLYSLTEGDGIDISTGQTPTITNSDRGSSQNIFKKVKLGDDNIEADSNTDTLEFAAGSGISLSIDTSNDKLTISNSSILGFTTSGTYAVLSSGITRAGIGTSTPSNTLEINSGTDGSSGVTFTQMTSSSTAGVGGGKVLSVDSGGKIILVTDQTGSTPTAESVLPSATNGMTLYFNGTNWVASDNLFHDGGSVGISNAAPTSRFQVNTNLASKIGVIVQGYTSQTANLQEWRNSSGSVLSYIDSNGVFNGSANTSGSLNPGFTTGSVAFQGASGLTQDNANFFWDDTNNRLGIGTAAPSQALQVTGKIYSSDSIYQGATPNAAWTNIGLSTTGQVLANGGINLYTNTTAGHNPFVGFKSTGSAIQVWNSASYMVFDGYGASTASFIQMQSSFNPSTGSTNKKYLEISPQISRGAGYTGSVYGLYVAPTHSGDSGTGQLYSAYFGGGNVGIGTATPLAKLHAEGLTTNAIGLFNQAGSGNILTASASGTTRMVLTNAGNLGLGTSSPAQLLDVQGKMRIEASGQYSNISNGIEFETSGVIVGNIFYEAFAVDTEQRGLVIKAPTAGTSNIQFQLGGTNTELYIRDSNQNALVTFQNGGNVGIGTTSPSSSLHVMGTTDASGALTLGQNGVTNGVVNSDASVFFNIDSNNDESGLRFVFATNRTGGTGGTELMRIQDNGNVGIGTTSPTALLDVAGSASLSGTLAFRGTTDPVISALNGESLTFQTSPGGVAGLKNKLIIADGTTTIYGNRSTNDNARMLTVGGQSLSMVHINPDNNGTSDSFTILRVDGGSTDSLFNIYGNVRDSVNIGAANTDMDHLFAVFAKETGDIALKVRGMASQTGNLLEIQTSGGTGVSAFDKDGDLGIGTITPNSSYKLHVNGNSYLAGQTIIEGANLGLNLGGSSVYMYIDQDASGNLQFRNSSDVLQAQINQTGGAIFNEQGNDSDFRVEGDTNANLLFVDASTDRVGIGTNTPITELDTVGTIRAVISSESGGSASRGIALIPAAFNATHNLLGYTNTGGRFQIGTSNTGGSGSGNALVSFGSGGTASDIRFLTSANSTAIERMRLDSNGYFGIGTTTPTSLLHVEGPTGSALTRFNQTGSGDILTASASGTTRLRIQNSGETWIGTTADLGFSTTSMLDVNGTIGLPSSGVLIASGGNGVLGRTGNIFYFQAPGSGNFFQLRNNSGTELINVDNSGNFGIGTTTFGTSAAKVLAIAGSTAPSTAITDGIQMFAVDQAGSHELRVMDEAGNTTTLSPHNFSVIGDQSEEMAWSFYSERNSLAINADMTKALRLVEKLSGEKLVYLKDLESGFMLEDDSDATHLTELADNGTIGEIAKWNYQLWTYVGEVVFEKPVTFLANIDLLANLNITGRITHNNKDTAGIAIVKAGATEVTVVFQTPYEQPPIITITPQGTWTEAYVAEYSTTGFTIQLKSALSEEARFTWQATAVKEAQTTVSKDSQPSPSSLSPSSPSPSPLETSSPNSNATSSSDLVPTPPVSSSSAQTAP